MKKICLLSLLIPLVMLLFPLPTLKSDNETVLPTLSNASAYKPTEIPAKNIKIETFKVYSHQSGEISEISSKDYIFGVLAAEMPALYEEEALKAQAVAAYTFACYRRETNKEKQYDITTDFSVDQAFITEDAAREKWGENADTYIEKLRKIVKETSGEVITHNGNLALSVYHSVSSGRTESAEDVWGSKIEYLVPVESSADRLADNYLKTLTFSAEEFRQKLSHLCEFSGEVNDWLGKSVCSDSGMVKSIEICKKSLLGGEIRKALDLPSANFEISLVKDTFSITSRGYGHGVGMSQYGANALAKQGSNYKEILNWYYKGCEVQKY